MKKTINVLIADDEFELRKSVLNILSQITEFNLHFVEAQNGKEAIEFIQKSTLKIHLVVMDVRMPEMNGLDALINIKEKYPEIFVIMLTAHSQVQDAIYAIKNGAYDYLEKPVQPEKLIQLIKSGIEALGLIDDILVNNPIFDDDLDSPFIKSSKKMKDIYELIYKLGNVDTTVLIRGENGTGKELVAKAIHQNSQQKRGHFVAINCAAISESLIESELFGHEKGAFTGADQRKIGLFQYANNGTIFLDEIAELTPDIQVKLLRVLQEKRFVPVGSFRELTTNVRILAATNRNLEKMIQEGSFREDLFYRLNVMPIFLPPLRERSEDIEELCQFFIKKYNSLQNQKNIKSIAPEALKLFKNYDWPGNIRELENVIERALILEQGSYITKSSLPDTIIKFSQEKLNPHNHTGPSSQMDFDKFKEEAEKLFITNALKANHGKINKTVANANIPKNTLLRKIKKYNINVDEFK